MFFKTLPVVRFFSMRKAPFVFCKMFSPYYKLYIYCRVKRVGVSRPFIIAIVSIFCRCTACKQLKLTREVRGAWKAIFKGNLCDRKITVLKEISTDKKQSSQALFLGIWSGNPRPFNDRDESAAYFFQNPGLFQAWSFSSSEKRNCLKRKKQLQFG